MYIKGSKQQSLAWIETVEGVDIFSFRGDLTLLELIEEKRLAKHNGNTQLYLFLFLLVEIFRLQEERNGINKMLEMSYRARGI